MLSSSLPYHSYLYLEFMRIGCLLWDNSCMSATVKMKKQGDLDWPRHYAALLVYHERYGHCNVHKKFKFEDFVCTLKGMGPDGSDVEYRGKLGTWLANQRAFHRGRRGEKRLLLPDREALLQKLVDEGNVSISYYMCTCFV